MNFAKFEFKKKLQRIVAKVTLVAMVATMMPAISAPMTAQAAEGVPEEITLTDHGYGTKGNVDYTSLNGLGSCTIHLLKASQDGEESIAFCADHTKRLVARVKGETWNNPTEMTSKWARVYLDAKSQELSQYNSWLLNLSIYIDFFNSRRLSW